MAVAACAYKSRAAIWLSSGAAASSFTNDLRLEFRIGIAMPPQEKVSVV